MKFSGVWCCINKCLNKVIDKAGEKYLGEGSSNDNKTLYNITTSYYFCQEHKEFVLKALDKSE